MVEKTDGDKKQDFLGTLSRRPGLERKTDEQILKEVIESERKRQFFQERLGNYRIGEHPVNPVTGQRYNPGNPDDPNHPNNHRGIRY